MRKNIGIIVLLVVVGLSGGCDVPWRALGSIAAASSTGDYGALLSAGTGWLGDRDEDQSDAWYCWPVCEWFD